MRYPADPPEACLAWDAWQKLWPMLAEIVRMPWLDMEAA